MSCNWINHQRTPPRERTRATYRLAACSHSRLCSPSRRERVAGAPLRGSRRRVGSCSPDPHAYPVALDPDHLARAVLLGEVLHADLQRAQVRFILSFFCASDSTDGLGSTAPLTLFNVEVSLSPTSSRRGRHLAPGHILRRLRRARRRRRSYHHRPDSIRVRCDGRHVSGPERRAARGAVVARAPTLRRCQSAPTPSCQFSLTQNARTATPPSRPANSARRQAVHASARRRRGAAYTAAGEAQAHAVAGASKPLRGARTARGGARCSDSDKKASEAAALAESTAAVAAAPNWPKAHTGSDSVTAPKGLTKAHAAFTRLVPRYEERRADRSLPRGIGGDGAGRPRGCCAARRRATPRRRRRRCTRRRAQAEGVALPVPQYELEDLLPRTRSSSASRCPASLLRADRAEREPTSVEVAAAACPPSSCRRPSTRRAARRSHKKTAELVIRYAGEPVDRDNPRAT